MIQVLGLREYTTRDGRQGKAERFFEKGWRANSVEEILQDHDLLLAKIPTSEQVNLYFTVADCFEEKGRKLQEQHVIPFDIDNLSGDTDAQLWQQAELAARAACAALDIAYEHVGVIFSGHGVQFFVKIPHPIVDDLYFDSARHHYKALCDRIQMKLTELGIQGDVDTSVFSAGRLMRMPNTRNRKPGKAERFSKVLQSNMQIIDGFYLDQKSGLKEVDQSIQIDPNIIKRYPTPDTEAVISGCEFIKWNFDSPEQVKEPQWYAAVSIVARLENGSEHVHRMSEKHPSYNHYETELKIKQATENAGPRTCSNINTLWDKCKTCAHFKKITSPILIHGENYIRSKDNGFRELRRDKEGNFVQGPVAFEDLILQFEKEFSFVTIADSMVVYVFEKTHWKIKEDAFIREWMREKVSPAPSGRDMSEFMVRMKAHNVKTMAWFQHSTDGLMNFSNGILDLKSMLMIPHNKDVGFTYVLPYPYDRHAACPTWDKFLSDVSEGDEKFVGVLEEYGGYAIMGGPCSVEKALILVGSGANGKSVYAETLATIVGEDSRSSIMLKDFPDPQSRAMLVNKLFNYSDESSFHAFADSSYFKTLVTGGEVTIKEVYKPKFMYKNRAKLIILANELPRNVDLTVGMYRRFCILEFKRQFLESDANKNLRAELQAELSGIINRLIAGFMRLKERRFLMDTPERSREMLEEYKNESDNVQRFIEDVIVITDNENDVVHTMDLFQAYMSWCQETNEKPTNMLSFSHRASKKLGPTHNIRMNGRVIKSRNKMKIVRDM